MEVFGNICIFCKIQKHTKRFRKIQRDSESFRKILKDSERFRKIQTDLERFRKIQKDSSAHEVINLTKFDEDWVKIVDFLPVANFRASKVFFLSFYVFFNLYH